ncbi:hypothetical protein GUJ93_ZPchr0010g8261 [Zizania palustris]|uniref:NADPH oxidase Respiratory burst domain-containing protein n=1 Tax=Zizania palustris TaxID=103762 RepID=A0A8J5WEL5_ZIZPA|nr:hypothetical protein GUJ93_ZPchr0010g8261 [Zizania palustris]
MTHFDLERVSPPFSRLLLPPFGALNAAVFEIAFGRYPLLAQHAPRRPESSAPLPAVLRPSALRRRPQSPRAAPLPRVPRSRPAPPRAAPPPRAPRSRPPPPHDRREISSVAALRPRALRPRADFPQCIGMTESKEFAMELFDTLSRRTHWLPLGAAGSVLNGEWISEGPGE